MSNVLRMSEEEYAKLQAKGKAVKVGTFADSSVAVVRSPPKISAIEERFAQQIAAHGLPTPTRNFFHITGRGFTLDFAWPDRKIGVEVQGAVHRVKAKFRADIEKRALAMLAGWRVLEVGGHEVRHDIAIRWLIALLGGTS